ncbi:MAG: alginate export family protein [Pseudomonadota bacterium]
MLLYLCALPVQAGGSYTLDFRARAEQVDDERLPLTARALTYRLHGSALTPLAPHLTLGTGFDVVRHSGAVQYHDGINGHTQYPDINDPDAEEIDELYLGYETAFAARPIALWAGRKAFTQGNNRFISGGLAWRQNGQSFDGLGISGQQGNLKGELVYLSQVLRPAGNRAFKGRQDLNAPVLGLVWTPPGPLTLEFSANRLRYVPGGPIATAMSTQAVVASLKAKGSYRALQLSARADLARQRPLYAGASEVGGDYYALEAGVRYRNTELKLAEEVLEGDGVASFQTPLASLHAFNGYADRFLRTPKDGLRDYTVTLSQQLGRYKLLARAHRFESTVGDYRYGDEIDLVASVDLPGNHKLLLKWADFQAARNHLVSARATTQSLDVSKLWLQWEWKWKWSDAR